MRTDLVYTIPKDKLTPESLTQILDQHDEIRFVSIAAVDLIGHETDTKIPIKIFRKDMNLFFEGIAAQTDGSSVFLPEIATLNNAKVDMVADTDCNWFVEYNYGLLDEATGKPLGTLKVPCYLYHEGVAVDSRHILQEAENHFKERIWKLFRENESIQEEFALTAEDIEAVELSVATELEFWVKSPSTNGDIEALSTSQELKEQYWSKTRGAVRSAMEEVLVYMDLYGVEPEMGHKEVGGVRAKLTDDGRFSGVLEQLEIDWRFSSPKQAGDYELLVKNLVREVFMTYGLEVTFLAKPMEKIAGSGEHTHFSTALRLKGGGRINLLTATGEDFMSRIGYGALMGILKNYEIINPFVTASNEAFKRLKKGYEAPISIVTSLGRTKDIPSRNRTVLIGLIRDEQNPLGTRFELRAPNPHTNTFLAAAAVFMAMIDGIEYASTQTAQALYQELDKAPGSPADYLEKDRAYRTEKDVFDDFTDEEREAYFGLVPETVFENISAFHRHPQKLAVLKQGGVFQDSVLQSFYAGSLYKWYTEIHHRILPNFTAEIRGFKKLHKEDRFFSDRVHWEKVEKIKIAMMKDTETSTAHFNKIRNAVCTRDFELLSNLQKEMYAMMEDLRLAYKVYRDNLMDI